MAESAIKRTLSDTERRARIFTVVSTGPAQNGTSGAHAKGKNAGRPAAWVPQRTGGVRGHSPPKAESTLESGSIARGECGHRVAVVCGDGRDDPVGVQADSKIRAH